MGEVDVSSSKRDGRRKFAPGFPDSGFKSWMLSGFFDTLKAMLSDLDFRKTPDPNIYWSATKLTHPHDPYGNESTVWWAERSMTKSGVANGNECGSESRFVVYIIEPGGCGTGNDHYVKQFVRQLSKQRSNRVFCVLQKAGLAGNLKSEESGLVHFADSMYTRDCIRMVQAKYGRDVPIALIGFSIGGLSTFKSGKDIMRTNAGRRGWSIASQDTSESIRNRMESSVTIKAHWGRPEKSKTALETAEEPVQLPAVVCIDFPVDLMGLFRGLQGPRRHRGQGSPRRCGSGRPHRRDFQGAHDHAHCRSGEGAGAEEGLGQP